MARCKAKKKKVVKYKRTVVDSGSAAAFEPNQGNNPRTDFTMNARSNPALLLLEHLSGGNAEQTQLRGTLKQNGGTIPPFIF
jgi:hypothetical protein